MGCLAAQYAATCLVTKQALATTVARLLTTTYDLTPERAGKP